MSTTQTPRATSDASGQSLRIAMIGTRGVPAQYGGFETAVEEIGSRLVSYGHEVTVYCRGARRSFPKEHRGMKLVRLPALHFKAAETLSHTALSVLHVITRRRPSMAFVFNAANSPFLPILRALRIPAAVHVDGLEWKRAKWGRFGRRFYRWAEGFATRWGDALISDATGIADYYSSEFSLQTEVISYGAPILSDPANDRLLEFGVQAGEYHLVVARFEPENHVDLIVEGYRRSCARHPLIVVGTAPYAAAYTNRIQQIADGDQRIQLIGAVYDQESLNQLYAHAQTYLHGHSVGGTNPSLLRAMGAGTAVVAWDVVFNQEVAGSDAHFFHSSNDLARIIDELEMDSQRTTRSGQALQRRAEQHYSWDDVAAAYEGLAIRLVGGESTAARHYRRAKNSAWSTDNSRPQPKIPGSPKLGTATSRHEFEQ